MPKKAGSKGAAEGSPARSRRRPTGAMARKPWEEAPPKKKEPKAKKAAAPEPAPAPSSSRRRRATGAMARKPWEEKAPAKASPKKARKGGREPEPEPEQEPEAQWDAVPFADYVDEPEQERDLFVRARPTCHCASINSFSLSDRLRAAPGGRARGRAADLHDLAVGPAEPGAADGGGDTRVRRPPLARAGAPGRRREALGRADEGGA